MIHKAMCRAYSFFTALLLILSLQPTYSASVGLTLEPDDLSVTTTANTGNCLSFAGFYWYLIGNHNINPSTAFSSDTYQLLLMQNGQTDEPPSGVVSFRQSSVNSVLGFTQYSGDHNFYAGSFVSEPSEYYQSSLMQQLYYIGQIPLYQKDLSLLKARNFTNDHINGPEVNNVYVWPFDADYALNTLSDEVLAYKYPYWTYKAHNATSAYVINSSSTNKLESTPVGETHALRPMLALDQQQVFFYSNSLIKSKSLAPYGLSTIEPIANSVKPTFYDAYHPVTNPLGLVTPKLNFQIDVVPSSHPKFILETNITGGNVSLSYIVYQMANLDSSPYMDTKAYGKLSTIETLFNETNTLTGLEILHPGDYEILFFLEQHREASEQDYASLPQHLKLRIISSSEIIISEENFESPKLLSIFPAVFSADFALNGMLELVFSTSMNPDVLPLIWVAGGSFQADSYAWSSTNINNDTFTLRYEGLRADCQYVIGFFGFSDSSNNVLNSLLSFPYSTSIVPPSKDPYELTIPFNNLFLIHIIDGVSLQGVPYLTLPQLKGNLWQTDNSFISLPDESEIMVSQVFPLQVPQTHVIYPIKSVKAGQTSISFSFNNNLEEIAVPIPIFITETQLYNIIEIPCEGGELQLSTNTATMGTEIILRAIAKFGYTFSEWIIEPGVIWIESTSTSSPATIIMPNQDVYIQAMFQRLASSTAIPPNTLYTNNISGNDLNLTEIHNQGFMTSEANNGLTLQVSLTGDQLQALITSETDLPLLDLSQYSFEDSSSQPTIIQLETSDLMDLVHAGKGIQLINNLGSFSLSATTLNSILMQASAGVTVDFALDYLSLASLDPETLSLLTVYFADRQISLDDLQIIDISIGNTNEQIHDLGGELQISISYKGPISSDFTLWHLKQDNTLEEIPLDYSPETHQLTFKVTELSYFIMGDYRRVDDEVIVVVPPFTSDNPDHAGLPIILTINSKVVRQGDQFLSEAPIPPQIINNRTMLPFRYLIQTVLGGTVDWNDTSRTITASVNGVTFQMIIDYNSIIIDGRMTKFDQAPIIVDGHALVPVRVFEQAVSLINWQADQQQVEIYMQLRH